MEQQYLTIWDLVLTPLYLVVLYFIARRFRDKHYPEGHPLRQYFLPGLLVKFAGAIFIALIYQYNYGGGDTFNYFTHSKIINSSLDQSFELWLKLLFRISPDADPYIYKYSSQLYWYTDPGSYTVGVIGAIFGLLNGTTYIPIALLFAFFSFTGTWAMFKTFTKFYPRLHKPLALAFLFIPGTIVWGSAIFKDTICMFALGWLTYTVFRVFLQKDISLKNLFLLVLSFFLIAAVKVYIILAFVPALSVWLMMNYSGKIRSKALRWTSNLVTISVCLIGLIFVSNSFSSELGRYSLERLAATAKVTQNYINYVSDAEGGSSYDLGEFEPTLTGMLAKFPQAVIVTLFRPFLWEARKPIVLLSAIESFAFFLLFIYAFFKGGLLKKLRLSISDPNLIFFLIYFLIFAFAVGISSGNFGALSRYKIPCIPFFAAFLLILSFSESKQEAIVKKRNTTRWPLASPAKN